MNLRIWNAVFWTLGVFFSVQLAGVQEPSFASYLVDTPTEQSIGNDTKPQEIFKSTEVTIHLEKKIPEGVSAVESPNSSDVATTNEPLPTASTETPDLRLETTPAGELEDPFKSASPDLPELKDPLVSYNRFMYRVNDSIFTNVIDPVAREYRNYVNEDVRISLRNLFNNASSAVKFVSSLLQGDLDKTARVLGRVVINSTIGIGGLFDVADRHFHIDDVNEDFGQTLGYYNVPTGPYIVIPFVGPSTARDIAGKIVDSFLSPSIVFAPGFAVGTGMSLTDTINRTSFILDDKKSLDESAVDEYESVRDFYHQYREGLVRK